MATNAAGRPEQRVLLDAAPAHDLVRRWQASESRAEWAPEREPIEPPAPGVPVGSVLPYALLPLGLLAVVALAGAIRGAIDAPDSLRGLQGLRLVMLGIASLIVAAQGWALLKRTALGRAVAGRLEPLVRGVRPERPWQPPPLLDAVSLAELRQAATANLGEVAQWERVRRMARRTTSGTSWWLLVVLSLVLSVGIVALMGGLIAREMADGRTLGAWMMVPGLALLAGAVGFAFTARTAIRSIRDRRQRHRGRLFRRIVGWIARGSPATGAPAAGAATPMAGGGLSALPSVVVRGGALAGATPAALEDLAGTLQASREADRSAAGREPGAATIEPADEGGGSSAPNSNDDAALPAGEPLHVLPFAAAAAAALFLGVFPLHGSDGALEVSAEAILPTMTPTVTPTPVLIPAGGVTDLANPLVTPDWMPDGFSPLPGGIGGPVPAPTDELADPATPPAAPPPASPPPVAPQPTPAPSPAPTPMPTPTATSTPPPTPTPIPTPTPTVPPTPTPDPPEEPETPPDPEPPPRDPFPPRR